MALALVILELYCVTFLNVFNLILLIMNGLATNLIEVSLLKCHSCVLHLKSRLDPFGDLQILF